MELEILFVKFLETLKNLHRTLIIEDPVLKQCKYIYVANIIIFSCWMLP